MGQKEQMARELANQRARKIADVFGSYIDKPNDPQARGSLQDPAFRQAIDSLLPQGHSSGDFGVLQQNPQYRGIRMVLPQSGGSYGESAMYNGSRQQGRILTEGPTGQPDPDDPHQNGIPRVPPNSPPDNGGLQQQVYGELISRGYPVLGGTGELFGYQPGFNPVGFGQRDLSDDEQDIHMQEYLNEKNRQIGAQYPGAVGGRGTLPPKTRAR